MTENEILIVIIIISTILLCLGSIVRNPEIIINFILRFLMGVIGIYAINNIFMQLNYSLYVGINGISALTVGILGLPGLILLYGIPFYLGK